MRTAALGVWAWAAVARAAPDRAGTVLDASFEHFLPPIFRAVLMTALCMCGFGVILQVLQHWDMNVFHGPGPASRLPLAHTRTDPTRESGALPLYLLALCHVAWSTFCWLMYRLHVEPRTGLRTLHAQAWETATLAGLLVLWIVPGPFRHLLRAWNRSLVRLFTPSLQQPILFTDVVLADILTSFAKVLGDVWLSLVLLAYFVMGQRADDRILLQAQTHVAVPVLISVPYMIRFRQCLSEYYTSGTSVRRPLYNALKYLSSLPVIWLRSWPVFMSLSPGAARIVDVAWYACVLLNTLFSFWWDVTNDWGLDLLQPHSFHALVTHPPTQLPTLHRRSSSEHDHTHAALPMKPQGHVRRPTVLRMPEKPLPLPPSLYWAILCVNLVLRFTWSVKLSSHWQFLWDWQRGLLLLEALEIVRRCVWVLLRVEWELVRQHPMDL